MSEISFFFSCPEWEKTHRSYAPRETHQLCCLNPKDLHSQGPEQPTHRHTNLYLWFRNRCLQVSFIQGRRVSALPSFFCWCCFNRGLLVFCADPVYWSRGCWLISSSRLFRVMELCSWPLTQRYSCKAVMLLSVMRDTSSVLQTLNSLYLFIYFFYMADMEKNLSNIFFV